MRSKFFLCFALVGVFVSGCMASVICKQYYFAPNASSEQEVSSPRVFDTLYRVFNTGPGNIAKIQIQEATLKIADSNYDAHAIFVGPYIFPIIPFFPLNPIIPPLFGHDNIEIWVMLSYAKDISWDISKCAIILPDGKKVFPKAYKTQWRPADVCVDPGKILTETSGNVGGHPYWVFIRYPLSIKEVKSFRLVIGWFNDRFKKCSAARGEFSKSIWMGVRSKRF